MLWTQNLKLLALDSRIMQTNNNVFLYLRQESRMLQLNQKTILSCGLKSNFTVQCNSQTRPSWILQHMGEVS
jgi:hypothetical protein